jgi:type IV pilus assembly protein PilW
MPVLAASGGASQSDAIAVLSGNAAYQAFNISVVNVPSSNSITVANNFDIQQNDYLIAPLSNGSCALTQVSTLSGTTGLILSTTNSSTANLPTAQYIFDLGAQPTYTLYGVNATNNTLVSYDLLQRTTNGGNTTTPIASGIVAMKVLYGIHDGSTSGMPDNYIDKWVQPTGTWDISALSASTSAAANAINEIKAVRIAVVAQSRLPESASSYTTGAATLTLFPDLTSSGLQYAVTTLPQYRYRVYDTTIPVQNAMINNHY